MVAWYISLSWVSQGRFIAHDTSLFAKIAVIRGDIFLSGVGSTPSLPKFFLLIVPGDAESVPLKKPPFLNI
jgi:hypothetical protein